MATDSADVYVAALSLPEASRADLAFKLLQSLKPATGLSEDDPQFEAELARRLRDYEADKTSASDWDTISARVHSALEGRDAK